MRFEDFFAGYTQQMRKVIQAQQQGDFVNALMLIPEHNKKHNAYNLSLLEKGRLAFLQQDWSQSSAFFADASQSIDYERAKAKIQISKGFENAGAVISNDSAIQYQVPAYEQSMMHSYQALNYVYQDNLESALVEVRKANLIQEQALRDNEDALLAAQQKMANQGMTTESLYEAYPSMIDMVGEVKNGFQNAFTFYLSGMLYESAGELNDAYIDYQKALEIFPNNKYLQLDVLRLAQYIGIQTDVEYTPELAKINQVENETDASGYVVVIYEQGLVNAKQEARLNLPLYTRHNNMRFFSFSLPVYRLLSHNEQPLVLHYNQERFQSDEIVVLQSLASKQLLEELPSLVTRQAIRLVAKEQMRKKMSKEGGDVGNILASLYNIASEHADTRSWLSLPNRIQLLKVALPVGQHNLAIEHANGRSIVEVNINKNRMTLINLTTVGNYSGYKTTNL
ncbi:COG3014 family protein [Colwelliaceae bacterium 6441]